MVGIAAFLALGLSILAFLAICMYAEETGRDGAIGVGLILTPFVFFGFVAILTNGLSAILG